MSLGIGEHGFPHFCNYRSNNTVDGNAGTSFRRQASQLCGKHVGGLQRLCCILPHLASCILRLELIFALLSFSYCLRARCFQSSFFCEEGLEAHRLVLSCHWKQEGGQRKIFICIRPWWCQVGRRGFCRLHLLSLFEPYAFFQPVLNVLVHCK